MIKLNIYIYVWIGLIIFSSLPLYSFSEININKADLQITLSNISEDILKDGKQFNDANINVFTKNDTSTKEIYFNIALPPSVKFNIDVACYSFSPEMNNTFKTTETTDSIFHVKFLGLRRGVSIYRIIINPYIVRNDNIYVVDSMRVNIVFSEKLTAYLDKDVSESIKSFYSDIINISQIPGFISLKNPAEKILSDKKWFDRNINYLKLTTQTDDVAKVDFSEILSLMPEWNGLPSSGLTLLHNGKNYPLYIKSQTGLLDKNASMYFLGKRASGDSTWYDNYTVEEPFFLYYSKDKAPERLTEFVEPAFAVETERVGINLHIEDDTEYYLGTITIYPRTDYLEGWYMANLSLITENWEAWVYQYSRLLPVLPLPNEELDISFRYATLYTAARGNNVEIGGVDPRRESLVKAILNDDTVSTLFNNKWTNETVNIKKLGRDLFSGQNSFRLQNRRVSQEVVNIGLDYIEIKGIAKAFPLFGKSQFRVLENTQNTKLKVHGFNSENIVYIDTLTNSIGFKKGISGYRYAASAGKKLDSAVTFVINDSLYRINSTGFFLITKTGNNINSWNYYQASQTSEIINKINSLADGSLIVAGYNADFNLPQEVKSLFTSLGSISAANINNTVSWAFATIKGYSMGDEAILSDGIASIGGFFDYIDGGSFSFNLLFNQGAIYDIFANSDITLQSVNISKVNNSYLADTNKSCDLIIIYNSKFQEPAKKLAEYRKSTGYKVFMADVEDIYTEYSYGKKSPHAIKDFLADAYQNSYSPKPGYLVIIGDASWDGRKVIKGTRGENYVPSFGQPVSDYWYGLLDGDDFEPELIIGRIPCQEPQEADNYINKMITFETQPAAPWMKKFLFLSGGSNPNERQNFAGFKYDVFDKMQPWPLCADTASVGNESHNAGSEEKSAEILYHINNGSIWTYYFGHSSTQIFEMDGWQVEYLNNKDKCGFLSTLSCNAGAFAEPLDLHGRNEQYILAKDKGFVAAFGSTGVGFIDGALVALFYMNKALAEPQIALRKAGDLLYYAKSKMRVDQEPLLATKELFQLLGDPLIRIRIGNEPDLFIRNNDINLRVNKANKKEPTESDKNINISGIVYNNGYALDSSFFVRLIRTYKATKDTMFVYYNSICSKEEFDFQLPVENMPGEHTYELAVFSNKVQDVNLKNNIVTSSFYVYSQNLLPVDPLTNWNVATANPHFRFINPLHGKFDFQYTFKLFEIENNSKFLLKESSEFDIFVNENFVDWLPEISLKNNGSFLIEAQSNNLTNSTSSAPVKIFFYAADNLNSVRYRLESASDFNDYSSDSLEFTESGISAKSIAIDYNVISRNGSPQGDFPSWGKIQVGDDVYFDSEYYMGFNVVRIPMDSVNHKGRFVRFETYGSAEDAENLVRLLKDTIGTDEYVIISTCSQSFHQAVDILPRTSIGYIDSLRSILKEYGVENTDSLNNNISFAYAGFRGASPDQIKQSINLFDTAQVTGNLIFTYLKGNAEAKPVGPAKKWDYLSLSGERDSSSAGNIIIRFYNPNFEQDTVIKASSFGIIDLTSIDAIAFPYALMSVNLINKNFSSLNKINSLVLQFEPAPELAVIKSNSYFAAPQTLRGDSSRLQVEIQNISLRSSSEESTVNIKITDETQSTSTLDYNLSKINRNDKLLLGVSIPTQDLSGLIEADIQALTDYTELYRFNNAMQAKSNLYEDTAKPTVIIKFDGKVVQNGDYISSTPEVTVELFDNSLLPITNSQDIRVRINGSMQTELNANDYEFHSTMWEKPLKASLSFQADTLREEENSLFVYISDATSNKDTIKMILRISGKGRILNAKVSPNPSRESSKFLFDVVSPNNNGESRIDMYNSMGEHVKQIANPIEIGNNIISWGNSDYYGNQLPQGIYFYRISIINSIYFKPVWGKFIIVK